MEETEGEYMIQEAPVHRAQRYIEKILEGSAVAGWAVIVLMMVWGTADVVGQVFHYSIPATVPWTEVLNVIAVILPLAYVTYLRNHVTAELFNIRGKAKRVLDIFILILIFLFMSVLAWQLSVQAWKSIRVWEFDQVIIKIYWFPAKIVLALGFIGSAIVTMCQIIGELLRWKEG
jgi:TRAP-type C4-dicarboxylate transport system permease small subunit